MKSKTCFILLVLITLISSCEEKKEDKELKVVTNSASEVIDTSVICNGSIADSTLISTIKECGFLWGTSNTLTVNDNKVISNPIKPSFKSKITGLKPNTNYFIQAYAINDDGTKYGSVISFKTKGQPAIKKIGITTCIIKLIDEVGQVDSSGVVWGKVENPTLESNLGCIRKTENVDSIIIRNLQSNDTYYVRYFASSSNGTYYAKQLKFTTKAAPTTVTDIDGNTYKTIMIGSQVWMAENLAVTRFADGTKLAQVKEGDSKTEAASYYWVNDGMPQYENEKYGALYNAAGAGLTKRYTISVQGVCPTNWHLPSDDEWKQIAIYLQKNGYNFDGTKDTISSENGYPKIGKSLASETGWKNDGTVDELGDITHSDLSEYRNKSGFNALPSGLLLVNDGHLVYWSQGKSARILSTSGKIWMLASGGNGLYFIGNANADFESEFYSVRCIADDN